MSKKQAPQQSNLPVKWDEELARQAGFAAAMENSVSTGQFFNLKGGILTWNDAPFTDNQMAAIILDSILENVYYADKFDPDSPQAPTCFAFGRDETKMKPHQVVVEAKTAQSDLCSECRWNEWSSAETGRGKACRNTRRLAMISGGNLLRDGKLQMFEPDEYAATAMGYMKLPVTSVKGYAGYVKQLAGVLKRPPFAVITLVKVVPDAKTQFKVVFTPLLNIGNELLGVMSKRNKEAQALIDFPYLPMEDVPKREPKQQRRRKY